MTKNNPEKFPSMQRGKSSYLGACGTYLCWLAITIDINM